MARREPGIRKHGNRYQIRIRVGGGNRIERTLPPEATYEDALEIKYAIRRAQIDAAAGRKPDVAIETLLDRWVEEEASKQDSWVVTKYKVGVLREYITGVPLSRIQDVVSALKKNDAKPATINRYLSILRRLANLARQWQLVDVAPTVVLLSEKGNERHVYLQPKDVDKLSRLAAECDPIVADAIVLSALTGLRRGELLRAASVHGNVLIVSAKTKSHKPRMIPLTPEALRIARRRVPWTIGPNDIRREFERAREAVGLSHVQFRDLRHTFASWLIQNGQNTKVVQELLGHAQLATTQRYAHLGADHLRVAVKGLPTVRKK